MRNKIFLLFKTAMTNTYGLNSLSKNLGGGQHHTRPRGVGMAAIIAVAAVSVLAALTMYFWLLADTLLEAGVINSLLTVIAMGASISALFMSLYKSPGHLYAAKDYDMLITLPVKPGHILASKILMLYLTVLVPSLAVTIPGLVIFGIKTAAGAAYYLGAFALALLLPVIPMLVGSLLAFPFAYITARFRFPSILVVLIYMALIVMIVVGSNALPMASAEQLEAGVASIAGMGSYFPPVWLFTAALGEGNVLYGLLLAASSLALFGLFVYGLARAYRRINAIINERHARARYRLKEVKVSSVLGALVSKEVKFYFSTYTYVLNTGVGMVLYTVYVAAMCFMGYDSVAMILDLPGGGDMFLGMTALLGAFCIAMSQVTASSISIEGDTLWILKSLPVRFRDIAHGKIILGLLVTAPLTFINTLAFAISTGVGAAAWAGMTLALFGFCAFVSVLGVLINLYFPKLNWKNPMQAVKQSASVILCMILSMAATVLSGIGFVSTGLPIVTYFYVIAAVMAFMTAMLWLCLYLRGQKLFDGLY